ncbi:hypothetical protein BM221_007958 [Beauveria bassiana]|uniref:SMP-30/Gluconolactonase/LRE-like region domain-containing protein n=1 Tax=Beauveria bassiana TaxID=176275 RepID=A0A2N6NES5_BEABA|nr:hypothetical protein BM221_007958 [Beauveria bassiana]
MALRPNGNILLTTFDQARIYELDASNNGNPPRLVATLPDADVAIGIAETSPDVFAVEAGHLNRTSWHLDGCGRIDTLDFSRLDRHGRPKVQTVAALPQAKLPNGMAALPMHSHLVLSADSITGTIYRTDTNTGNVDVAIQDPKLAPHDDPDPFLNLIGVNGLQTHDGYLYVTSTSAQFLGRYKIDPHGNPLSELEILVTYDAPRSPDDFAVARDGSVFGAVPLHSVSKVTIPQNGSNFDMAFLVDHDGELQRPTAAILSLDETTLYISTGGRNEEGGKGGQISAVRLT